MWSEALPIVVYSTFTQVQVRVPDWARLYASMQALKGHAQEYPGCQRFDVYQSKNEETRFFLCEWWESQDALDQHRKGVPYTQIYQPQILPKVTREPHPSNLVA